MPRSATAFFTGFLRIWTREGCGGDMEKRLNILKWFLQGFNEAFVRETHARDDIEELSGEYLKRLERLFGDPQRRIAIEGRGGHALQRTGEHGSNRRDRYGVCGFRRRRKAAGRFARAERRAADGREASKHAGQVFPAVCADVQGVCVQQEERPGKRGAPQGTWQGTSDRQWRRWALPARM